MLKFGNLLVLDSVDSTQDELRRNLADKNGITSVIALSQNMGRGRQGRVWHSPPGSSLSLSTILPEPNRHSPWLNGMHAALAIAEAFDLGLIWPNDLVLATAGGEVKKVGGILLEMQPTLHGSVGILGIGINLTQTEFPDDIADRATSLAIQGRKPKSAIEAGTQVLSALRKENPISEWGEIAERWSARDHTAGKPFITPDGRSVVAGGYGKDGSLIGNYEGGSMPVYVADYWGTIDPPNP